MPANQPSLSAFSLYSVKWRFWRRGVQLAALALFIALFIASRRSLWQPDLINIPIRLDPLAVLANALASRTWLPTSFLILVTLGLTVVFGRAWCGWLCPLGTVLDLTQFKEVHQDGGISDAGWRSVKYLIFFSILTAALFTNLTLLALDPLTIFFRTLSVTIWPAIDSMVRAIERFLYQIPILQNKLTSLDELLSTSILPSQPTYYRDITLFLAFFIAILLLNRLASRFWCRYLCPLGGMLGLVSKLSIFKRKVSTDCSQCGLCSRHCPTGAIQPEKDFSSDQGECIICMQCVENCPRSATKFPARLSADSWNSYNPQRRQVLTMAALTLAGIAVTQADSGVKIEHPYLVRPPGVTGVDFLSHCIRCGECSRACPTSAIQPSLTEAGLVGLWTPVLIMRLGYCDYSCNACGQVCPVQAITDLSLNEKRLQVIGKAQIDKNRCIAWAQRRACIICEEMCPLPEKAIVLDKSASNFVASDPPDLRLPFVVVDKCIGCGICEYKCPVASEAAIRVYNNTPTIQT